MFSLLPRCILSTGGRADANVSLPVRFAPEKVRLLGADANFKAGDRRVLTCRTDPANPPWEVKWTVQPNPAFKVSPNMGLRILMPSTGNCTNGNTSSFTHDTYARTRTRTYMASVQRKQIDKKKPGKLKRDKKTVNIASNLHVIQEQLERFIFRVSSTNKQFNYVVANIDFPSGKIL